ncbi:MAG: hypothetical protein PWQ14_294 [Rikenellaceae bacterium]|nr:hypothetical protein [Rikenellaceae bacterium]
MKKFFKILGIVIGSIAALLILIGIVVFGGSYLLDAKKEVENPVYPPDKTWTFTAEFYDTENKLIRTDTLKLKTINQRFMLTQNKIKWILKSNNKTSEEITGIIENEKRLWIHPPRFDDYFEFTEYSAFPEIRKPISINNKWGTQLMLGTYADKEMGNKMTLEYSIINIDTINTSPTIINVKILGKGKSGLGTYTCEMDFHEKKGFTKLTYLKQNNEKLIIQLIDER